MSKRLLLIGMILLAVAAVVVAADAVSGKWTFEQSFGRGRGPGGPGGPGAGPGGPGGGPGGPGGPGGMPPRIVTMDLKVDGAKLTGTMTMPGFGPDAEATSSPISNGKVEGNNISFDVARETPMGSMTTKYAGTVSGSEMKLKSTMENPQGGEPIVREITAKKQ